MLSNLKEYVFGSPEHSAVQLTDGEPLVYPIDGMSGALVRVRPYEEAGGIQSAAAFFRAVHDLETSLWGRNTSPAHAFELWFDGTQITFYLYAASESAADRFRRAVAETHTHSDVTRISDGQRFPRINPGEYVAGAHIQTTQPSAYPLRAPTNAGFATDPYGEITRELLAPEDTRVVTQVVFRPAKPSWTDGSWFRHDSIDDIAHALRQGTSVGWLNPRTRPASVADKQAAKTIEQQRGRAAYHTNIRILAISPSQQAATQRVQGIASMFANHYTGVADQRLTPTAVWHHNEETHANRLRKHVGRMADREWQPRQMILTVPELAGVAHLPDPDVETPHIDWHHTQRGDNIPATAPTHSPPTNSPTSGSDEHV